MTIQQQGELLKPVHKSRQRRRLRKPAKGVSGLANPERIYAAEWVRMNRPTASYPRGILELILQSDRDLEQSKLPTVSQRDAEVAAAVIQWLGTNVGLGLIMQAERKIEAARMEPGGANDCKREARLPKFIVQPRRTRDIELED